jgi:RNA polymerase sigma-70 factor (ECF subfamily)
VTEATPGEITQLLEKAQGGDREAVSELAIVVFPELRKIAAAYLRGQAPNHTWLPTDLVNELWVRLLGREGLQFENRCHFLGCAAHLMRALVMDHARARSRRKRTPDEWNGAGSRNDELRLFNRESTELLALDEALSRLKLLSERQVQIVELRYFAGFTIEETASALEVSPRTVKRDWEAARVWLHAELRGAWQ